MNSAVSRPPAAVIPRDPLVSVPQRYQPFLLVGSVVVAGKASPARIQLRTALSAALRLAPARIHWVFGAEWVSESPTCSTKPAVLPVPASNTARQWVTQSLCQASSAETAWA